MERTGKAKEHYDRSQEFEKQKNAAGYKKALAGYNEVIKLLPNDSESYNNRARCYLSSKQLEKALDDHNRAISLDPMNYEFYLWRSITYNALGKMKEAKADIEKAAELNSEYADRSYFIFADSIYHYTKNRKEAAEYYKKVVKLGGLIWGQQAQQILDAWGMRKETKK